MSYHLLKLINCQLWAGLIMDKSVMSWLSGPFNSCVRSQIAIPSSLSSDATVNDCPVLTVASPGVHESVIPRYFIYLSCYRCQLWLKWTRSTGRRFGCFINPRSLVLLPLWEMMFILPNIIFPSRLAALYSSFS